MGGLSEVCRYKLFEIYHTLGYSVTVEAKTSKIRAKDYIVEYRLVEEFKPAFSSDAGSISVGEWKKVGRFGLEHKAASKFKEITGAWTFEDFIKDYQGGDYEPEDG